jgi:hypothetical protein
MRKWLNRMCLLVVWTGLPVNDGLTDGASIAVAAETEPAAAASLADRPEIVKQAIAAAGGEDRLLALFRIKERLNVSSDPQKAGFERISVLQPPQHWWVGTRDRVVAEKEPATFLVWAWTLRIFLDPQSKIESLPAVQEGDHTATGVRVSGTVVPPMDLYFSSGEHRLLRIDWRSDIHRFTDWKQHDEVWYPAKCVGYKQASGKPWYFTEILELERLTSVPADLVPQPASEPSSTTP